MRALRGLPFHHGQHICALYDSPEEQLTVASVYLADGLESGDRCLYAAPSIDALDAFRASLRANGTDAAAAESSGALLLLTKHQTHLVDGYFDTERMLHMLNGGVEDALNAGFTGLRTCGDMTWLLDNAHGSEHVVEYEALLNQFFRQTRASGMCQYDVHRLPVGLLDHAGICTHSTVVLENTHKQNPFCASDSGGHQSSAATFQQKFAQLRAE